MDEKFPPEIWTNILRFLPEKDIKNFRCTCKLLNDAASAQIIWLKKSRKAIKGFQWMKNDEDHSPYTLYSQVIYRYGYLQGNWQPKIGHYGGFISVEFQENSLIAYSYECPRLNQLDHGLSKTKLFTVSLNEHGTASLQCYSPHSDVHECEIRKLDDGQGFEFTCSQINKHAHPDGERTAYHDWMLTGMDIPDEYLFDVLMAADRNQLALERFNTMRACRCHFTATRLSLPTATKDVIIQPGLFKGTYSAHGVELLMLTYENDYAILRKITGDPNVPAGNISMKADLKRPMLLREEQQSSMTTLRDIDTADLPPDTAPDKLPPQPFYVPADCHEREANVTIPRVCKARFHSQGQIAGSNFMHPEFIKSHWVIFDENFFGHLWLGLRALSVYCRVNENFS